MRLVEDRYISLLTDFGFKRIFGTEKYKDLLIHFLNSLFDGEQVITDVTYLNAEQVGDTYVERKAIFDVYCENEKGDKFVVEMQNAFQQYFKDRSLFYATFPIREQAPKGGDWNFELKHVYIVALLNFDMHEPAFDPKEINHDVGLLDKKTHDVFNPKLTFKYIEIAKFHKTETELVTPYDKWMYILKNLSRLEKQPVALQERVFTRLFEIAEIAMFTPAELHEYEDSFKTYRDMKNSLDTAKDEGLKQGRAEGKAEGLEQGRAEGIMQVAKTMLTKGMDIDTISMLTGLTKEEIPLLKD